MTRREFLAVFGLVIGGIAVIPAPVLGPAMESAGLDLDELFRQIWAVKRAREVMGKQDHIDLWMPVRSYSDEYSEAIGRLARRFYVEHSA